MGNDCQAEELSGLRVTLDRLVYHYGGCSLPSLCPHAFVYFLTIHNDSERTVTLLGRKWVVRSVDGGRTVIEGDKIVGEVPRLAPGEQFSYNSFHCVAANGRAEGSFHGVDEAGRRICVPIPPFDLVIPPGEENELEASSR